MPGGRQSAAERAGDPGQDQAGDIAEIVPGIGDQREGMGEHAIDHLDADEGRVQDDADEEGPAEVRRRMGMAVAAMVVRVPVPAGLVPVVRVVVIVVMMIVMTVMIVAGAMIMAVMIMMRGMSVRGDVRRPLMAVGRGALGGR
jgi:hypothetical protein